MSDPKKTETAQENADRMERRDGELYRVLGFFIGIVGLPVLIGTFWAIEKGTPAAVVNASCGIILLLVAGASAAYGQFLVARQNRQR